MTKAQAETQRDRILREIPDATVEIISFGQMFGLRVLSAHVGPAPEQELHTIQEVDNYLARPWR